MKKQYVLIFLSLMLIHLLVFSSSSAKENSFFTLEQENYFVQNPNVYAYFAQMYTYKKTPAQMAKEFGLTEDISRKYLKSLADIGVIKPNIEKWESAPHFLVNGVSRFSTGGPLSRKFSELMFKEHYEKIKEATMQEPEKNVFVSFSGFWLTEAEYLQYRKDLEILGEKYIDLSLRNRKSKNLNAFRISTLFNFISEWEPKVFNEVKKDF